MFLIALLVIVSASPSAAAGDVFRVGFGSCLRQNQAQPIWEAIHAAHPDVFLLIGDNVYADARNASELRAAYSLLAAQPGYRRLREICPVHATWDDHDYGADDAGADYPMRVSSERTFLDFFRVPEEAPERTRPGVYGVHEYGPPERRVQIILLDTRYFRGPLKRGTLSAECPLKHYLPNEDSDVTLLGEPQWRWLEDQLRRPAKLRIVASSIQVIPTEQCFEKWANLPRERERLLRLIESTAATGVVFISGDRHHAEISRLDQGVGYPLYEVTSSSLNAPGGIEGEANRFRVTADNFRKENFGMIEVDWSPPQPAVSLQIRNVDGKIVMNQRLDLGNLRTNGFRRRSAIHP